GSLNPAKSSDGVAPLSFTTIYQDVRQSTMNVLALLLTMPRNVATAQTKRVPASVAPMFAPRSSGTMMKRDATISEESIFQATKRGLMNDIDHNIAVVPTSDSRIATSAIEMAMAGKTTTSTGLICGAASDAMIVPMTATASSGMPVIVSSASASAERRSDGREPLVTSVIAARVNGLNNRLMRDHQLVPCFVTPCFTRTGSNRWKARRA